MICFASVAVSGVLASLSFSQTNQPVHFEDFPSTPTNQQLLLYILFHLQFSFTHLVRYIRANV